MAAAALPALGDARTSPTPRARPGALRAERAALARRENRALLGLYAVETRLVRARNSAEALGAQAAAVAREREVVRRHTAAVGRSLAAARRRLARELRSLYEQGQPDAVAILLGATSIDEAVAGIDSLKRVANADRRMVADLRRKEARLRALEAVLDVRNRQLAAARRSAGDAAAWLGTVAGDRARALAGLRARGDLTRREIAELDAAARRAERRSATLTRSRARAAPVTIAVRPVAASIPGLAGKGRRALVVDAVAYHLTGRTASGLPVGVGVVAVDPAVIPLGTRIFVPGYGPAVAADVGTAIKENIIDLWMPTRAEARAWGRRTVTITIYG
jgi:peptidoglycan DL-endopeptidase CwlO